MTMRSAKLRCGFQEGVSAFEPTKTEADQVRLNALF
jgi:hypothetical protein